MKLADVRRKAFAMPLNDHREGGVGGSGGNPAL